MPPVDRPARLIAVVGTGTEVGKTWVSARLLSMLRRRGLRVAARKPAQSFEPDSHEPTDAHQLAAATGELAVIVCPAHRWYPVAMAPPMAADKLQRSQIFLAELLAEITWPAGIDVGLVETAGGLCSPIAHDADCNEFVERIAPDEVLLVGDAGLGTINGIRLAMRALNASNVTVLLNRFDGASELHGFNRDWLRERDGFRVITDVTDCVSEVKTTM